MAERRPRKCTRGLAGSQPRSRNGSTQLRWLQARTYGPSGRRSMPSARTLNTDPSSRRSSARATRKRSGELESERELLGGMERVGADAAFAQVLREVLREAVDRVDLVRARQADDVEQLVEVAVVGERKRQVGAEDAPEARVLGPARDQRGAIAAQGADRLLADRRGQDDPV